MSKGSLRKNHKQKLDAFKQRRKETENRTKKMQQAFMENYYKQQETARQEFMIETIYNNKNELVKEVDGIWSLNDDAVETKDDMLVWKADGNPLLAGLETSIDAYSIYTKELVNGLLPQIQGRLKWKAEKQLEENKGFEVLPVSEADFEIVEDPSYKEVE